VLTPFDPEPQPSELVALAHELGIDVAQTRDANGPRVRRWLRAVAPDAYVVCGFPHLLGPEVLGLARRGGLNLHPGRLPADRGPAPLFWALKAGRTTVGWTLHVLERGEDAGDVVASGEVSFAPGARGMDVLEQVALSATPALVKSLRGLLDGDLVRTPQPPPSGPRGPRPGFRDGRIDPGRPAQAVFTFVAGCAGRYPLFVESAGDRFFVADALSYDTDGQLAFEYALTGDRLLLRCDPGVVELLLREDGALFSPDY
jgi:methionyl-tRNA formyltransferase